LSDGPWADCEEETDGDPTQRLASTKVRFLQIVFLK
jgi:hypothetical protein